MLKQRELSIRDGQHPWKKLSLREKIYGRRPDLKGIYERAENTPRTVKELGGSNKAKKPKRKRKK